MSNQQSMMPTYHVGNSFFHHLDSRVKLAALVLCIIIILFSKSLITYALSVILLLTIFLLSRLHISEVLSPILWCLPFFIVIFIMNFLFNHSPHPLFHWWIFAPSIYGLIHGAQIVMRVILVMIVSNIIMMTTPPVEMTYSLESLIKPLRWVGLPVAQIALIISIAVQFIPSLYSEAQNIREAQIARGAQFESKNLWKRGIAYLPLLLPIFLNAFRRADELSTAMEARGYRVEKTRMIQHFGKFDSKSKLTLAIFIVLCVAQIALSFLRI